MATTQDPIATPEVKTVVAAVDKLLSLTNGYEVTTPEAYSRSGEHLIECKREQRRVEDLRTSLTRPINASLKRLNEFFAGPTMKLKTIEADIKRARSSYEAQQERIRVEAQRRVDEAARKEREAAEAEAAKVRAVAKAAADKLEAEAAAKRELEAMARREAERAALAVERAKSKKAAEAAEQRRIEAIEREQVAAEAARKLEARAEAKIEAGEAKAVAAEAVVTAAPVVVASNVPSVEGISARVTWHGECTNLGLLIAAVAAGKAPAEFLVADTKAIAAYARKVQKPVDGSGIRVWSTSAPVVRTAEKFSAR